MKTAIVTGADRGLGCSITKILLERGYRVIAGEYNKEWSQLNNISADNLFIIPLDIADQASINAMSDFANSNFDGIDLLVNSAGIINKNRNYSIRDDLDVEAMKHLFDINAVGTLRVCKAIIPLMKGLKRICIISSEAGSVVKSYRTGWYAYCMSKAALNMAATIMFNDLKQSGYTFRVIHPGYVGSYMDGKKATGKYEPDEAAAIVVNTCLELKVDEDRIYMIDDEQNEYPW